MQQDLHSAVVRCMVNVKIRVPVLDNRLTNAA